MLLWLLLLLLLSLSLSLLLLLLIVVQVVDAVVVVVVGGGGGGGGGSLDRHRNSLVCMYVHADPMIAFNFPHSFESNCILCIHATSCELKLQMNLPKQDVT